MKSLKFVGIVLCALLATDISFAQKETSSRPSSRPSTSSSRSSTPSSRPSSSSKPSMSKPSSKPSVAPSKPSSRPGGSTNNSVKPSGSSSKPTAPSGFKTPTVPKTETVRPSSRPNAPVKTETVKPSSRPNVTPTPVVPKTEVVKPSSRPNSTTSAKPQGKPTQTFDTAASTAQKKAESKALFQASKPKEEYKTPTGKIVKIDTAAPSVKTIQSTPPEKYEQRTTRVEHHYHNHYGDRYGYYRSQPFIDVGGGYSALFWYAMMDWNAQRRAEWLYHHQNVVNQQLFNEQMQNAQLKAEVERLKASNVSINPNYVDSEFKDDPDLMYDDSYVAATYNPEPVAAPVSAATVVKSPVAHKSSGSGWKWFWIISGTLLVLGAVYYMVFVYDFKL